MKRCCNLRCGGMSAIGPKAKLNVRKEPVRAEVSKPRTVPVRAEVSKPRTVPVRAEVSKPWPTMPGLRYLSPALRYLRANGKASFGLAIRYLRANGSGEPTFVNGRNGPRTPARPCWSFTSVAPPLACLAGRMAARGGHSSIRPSRRSSAWSRGSRPSWTRRRSRFGGAIKTRCRPRSAGATAAPHPHTPRRRAAARRGCASARPGRRPTPG
jgi:hypothetical protein